MVCAETAGKERSPCETRGVLLLKLASTPTNSSNNTTCLRLRNIQKKTLFFKKNSICYPRTYYPDLQSNDGIPAPFFPRFDDEET
jgi:hypothetical protein